MNIDKTNWKTTVAGFAAAIGVLCIGISSYLDGDPSTKADFSGMMEPIGAIFAFFGIGFASYFTKDKDKD